ncbi:MAG: CP12 domain-containing protein [Cyanobacteriota bacterium]|nr:CP12 domain-containing protein [Cyanobacteriota bacterium]
MSSIAAQLETYRSALAEATARGDQAVSRKIEQQIKDLEEFQLRHPDETEAPTPFEVFCDLNPSDVNCLVYDD